MAINSAQGIASLFRGNPEQLQQSMQKEQQAKPGLPPDLQKMLALQIVTNEEDRATAQKAMDQLQQMSGQGGKPPTVMASLQQQAEQKLQAKAVQDQQKKQGIQSLMQNVPASGVPEGTPEPDVQPKAQGIDQLPVEFAGAEGGIVSFANEGEVPPADIDARYDRETEELGEGKRTQYSPEVQAYVAKKEQQARAGQDEYMRREQARQLAGNPMMNRQSAKPQPTAPDVDNQSAAETARLQRQKTLPQAPAPAPAAPINDIKDLAARKIVAPAPAPAPVMEKAPAPVAVSPAQQMVTGRMNASPEAKRIADVNEYKQAVGSPDTAQYDRLIAELEKRKESLAPKQGFEGLMEYLAQVSANSQPGRGSAASGAAGARALDKLNNERRTQQFELSKQAVEVSQKKLDTVRAYAKDVYGVGKSAFDQVYKDQYDAAKELVKDENEARKLAQENTLKRLQMQNNLAVQGLQNQGSLASANARGAGAGTGDKQQLAELKALQTNLKDQLKDPSMMGKAGASLRAQLAQVNAAVARMAGLDTMGTAPGAGSPGGNTRMQFDAQGNQIK